MPRGSSGPGDNSGKRFEEIIDRLYWTDEEETNADEDEEDDQDEPTDDEEDELGYRCIGCPIFDRDGLVQAAVSISGTTSQIREDNAPDLAQELKQTAAAVSEALGYCPSSKVQRMMDPDPRHPEPLSRWP